MTKHLQPLEKSSKIQRGSATSKGTRDLCQGFQSKTALSLLQAHICELAYRGNQCTAQKKQAVRGSKQTISESQWKSFTEQLKIPQLMNSINNVLS